MKKLEKFSAANSGWTVVVFAVIGYLISCVMQIFGIFKNKNEETKYDDEDEAECAETETMAENQTETQEE